MAPLPTAKIQGMEDRLLTALRASPLVTNASLADKALGVQALSWYADTAASASLRQKALALALSWAKSMRADEAASGAVEAPAVQPLAAQALFVGDEGQAALLAAAFHQPSQASAAKSAATLAWRYLNSHYGSAKAGLYLSQPGYGWQTYTPDLIADVIGAPNVAQNVLGAHSALSRYAVSLTNAVDSSHLIASQLPSTASFNNGLPMPPKAGGTYGIAPVFRSGVAYDMANGARALTNPRFTTAQALHPSDEMFWTGIWYGLAVQGPPALGPPNLSPGA